MTIGAEQTIRGAGALGGNGLSLDNLGTILAQGDEQLIIDTNSSGFDQNGVLKAQGRGGLLLIGSSLRFNKAVEVETGSKLSIESANIQGAINVAVGAEAEIISSTVRAVTVNGNIVQRATTNTVRDGLTNNGLWTLDAAVMSFSGSQVLAGNGEIALDNDGQSTLRGNGGKLTIGAGQKVSGAGQLGLNSLSFLNRGEVHASSPTDTLRIDANATGFDNEGTIRATGAGGLVSVGNLTQLAGATIVDSMLTFQSGEFELAGGVLGGSGRLIGNVVQSGGVVNAGNSPGEFVIEGDLEQTADAELHIEIAGREPGEFDTLIVEGTASLDGFISAALLGRPQIDVGDRFDVLLANVISGQFLNTQVEAGLAIFDVSIIDGAQDVVRLTAVQASPVPLPAAVWMLMSALAITAGWRRLAS